MEETERQVEQKFDRPYKTGGYRQNGGKDRVQNRTVEILPHPEVLESYNYVVDGSAKMILTMFEIEQKHRHEWEMQAIKVHRTSTVLGQILGFLIAVSIFISATVIGMYGHTTIAATIWVFGMSIVVMAGMVWAYAKSMGQRPLFARPTMRTHFRPQKERTQELPETD
ncbi:MAG: DUF2335 domain-containing protein [Rickettsiales bacterium]|jgi:uncharacterized membrane protein|nr:DUF2335 domain-containing protein [Rickettsiales bacterium]